MLTYAHRGHATCGGKKEARAWVVSAVAPSASRLAVEECRGLEIAELCAAGNRQVQLHGEIQWRVTYNGELLARLAYEIRLACIAGMACDP